MQQKCSVMDSCRSKICSYFSASDRGNGTALSCRVAGVLRYFSAMRQRATWITTTHDWSLDVDRDHLKAVRDELARPGAAGGTRHLILEVLAYAQDEAASIPRRGTVIVTRHPDGSVSVDDDGRGTDTRTDQHGEVIRKPVMATADIRFSDPTTAPRLSDGLPRRGMSSVAALSAFLVHENHRANGAWAQTYRYGIPDTGLAQMDPRDRSGTVVTFRARVDGPDQLTQDDAAAFPDLDIRVF